VIGQDGADVAVKIEVFLRGEVGVSADEQHQGDSATVFIGQVSPHACAEFASGYTERANL